MKKYGLLVIAFPLLLAACKKKDTAAAPPDNGFNGPTYSDNYTAVASWDNRSQWNLANVHDPTVVKDGQYYYMYQTNASYGNAHDNNGTARGLYMYRRSKDLVNWEYRGFAFASPPAWIKDSMNNKRARMGLGPIQNPRLAYWAPCIRKVGNKFRMYYSVVVDELIIGASFDFSWGERPYIGLAETDNLETNHWTDLGMVVCSEAEPGRSYVRNGANDWSSYYQFNAIDPSFIVTPQGEHWLIYGSWMTGIAALQLNPATGKPTKLETITDYGVRIAGRGNVSTNRWQAMEAPEIIYNEATGFYYLFLAYDELAVAYNTRVARSRNITGPYVGINGGDITAGAECWPMATHPYAFDNHTGWVGISHGAVFQDPASLQWYFASQGRLPENVPGINASNAVMMGHVREIKWTADGWPVIAPERYAGVPHTTIQKEAIPGVWEQITMDYQYRTIQRSVKLTLSTDNKVTGAITGTWSFDETKGVVMINNLQLNLFDAWDWEAAPRKQTLAYSGYSINGRPVWGKKLQ
jgi:arabinan endo-1,5-alpha-L-arabinosidase